MITESEYRTELRRHRRKWMRTIVTVGTPQPVGLAGPWGEWLGGFAWDAWGTLTFDSKRFTHPTPEQLTRGFHRFVAWLRAEGNPDVSWYFAHEVGALGRSHLHCLLGTLASDTPRSSLWRWWWKRYGRNEIRGYDREKGAAHYVAKYVAKTYAHYDLDLGGFDRCQAKLTLPLCTPTWKRTRGRSTT